MNSALIVFAPRDSRSSLSWRRKWLKHLSFSAELAGIASSFLATLDKFGNNLLFFSQKTYKLLSSSGNSVRYVFVNLILLIRIIIGLNLYVHDIDFTLVNMYHIKKAIKFGSRFLRKRRWALRIYIEKILIWPLK